MSYRYAVERTDHSALASGQVLRSAPGFPGFPVRMASELFQRAMVHTKEERVRLWDPCCGSGYLVTVLGFLHRDRLTRVRASDVDPDAVALAARNLRLLSAEGLAEREDELRRSARDFGRPEFVERAESTRDLAAGLSAMGGDLPHEAVVGDVFALREPVEADLVVTDVPYGEMTSWAGDVPGGAGDGSAGHDAGGGDGRAFRPGEGGGGGGEPLRAMLASLGRVLPEHAVVVVTARTRRISLPEGVRALERVKVGNRAAALVRARDIAP
ncbi:rRNA methyltransferase [Nocardiopsis sp. CT-R113]|uniref:rRNA methyltransferase n=1 Tax=Nocardiopsis codii TaxID=3065942 RepID=A0ABU7KBK2_9ACTN|nr:rRNA methyltransferase [Nocardiopsis sp. CT-R113]MEE2039613.1 rRNA methyltransferase [Nocardiopsis sp. CT-R113]